jgi:hypothetical protein
MKIGNYKHQKGNVLFLILIAVALFAALSYAVTQSSRSGGDASKETNVINTASLTQYPNSVRTSVLRLIIAGVDPLDIQFNKPDEFDTGTNPGIIPSRAVFHPQGGAATYQQIPANITSGGAAIDWRFNANFEVPLLGLSQASSGNGNELIAFAYGVSQSICGRVNKELHNDDTIPVTSTTLAEAADGSGTGINNSRTATTASPQTPAVPTSETVLTSTGGTNWFSNKAFGCFANGSANGPYVFYYVLAER